jgi:hypothetical protein
VWIKWEWNGTHFLMATFSLVWTVVARMTLPYVPSPSCLANWYRFIFPLSSYVHVPHNCMKESRIGIGLLTINQVFIKVKPYTVFIWLIPRGIIFFRWEKRGELFEYEELFEMGKYLFENEKHHK